MGLIDLFKRKSNTQTRGVLFATGESFTEFIGSRYRTLANTPEIASAVLKIASMIASETIYLMANTESGDIRVNNELSRKIDIEPNKSMTRYTLIMGVVKDMLLNGNAIIYPHFTREGGRLLLGNLEPISQQRVSYLQYPAAPNEYAVQIDGVNYSPDEILHFVFNPSEQYRWLGEGVRVPLNDLEEVLSQANETSKGFMNSKWKPSIIIKVDANNQEFQTVEGRDKILNSYIKNNEAGKPWVIPADQFDVEQVKPLTLNDLAITDTVKLNKQAVASLLGVPAFVLGVGEFKADEWDYFINNTIRPLAQNIEQELTRKLITSPKMYLMFNPSKLYSYDLQKIANVYGNLYDKGIVTGNEVRDKLGMQPHNELNGLMVLENYIPVSQVGNQKKLNN